MKVSALEHGIEVEGARAGLPAIFLEFDSNNMIYELTATEIYNNMHVYEPVRRVTIVGADEMIQNEDKDLYALLNLLSCSSYEINIETTGNVPLQEFIIGMAPYLSDMLFFTVNIINPSRTLTDVQEFNVSILRSKDVVLFEPVDQDDFEYITRLLDNSIRANTYIVLSRNASNDAIMRDAVFFITLSRHVNCILQYKFEF